MRIPDNAWEQCWNDAAPLAAVYQTSHFNEATVAENVSLLTVLVSIESQQFSVLPRHMLLSLNFPIRNTSGANDILTQTSLVVDPGSRYFTESAMLTIGPVNPSLLLNYPE